ncbi:hypothetical protein [Cryptosporangium minutisporangium]|uniref:Membrane protein n=1 Tax=Cryptosporangium minutisporangium TaxID=113569 RepID=A0ABP6SNK2_9ACTN
MVLTLSAVLCFGAAVAFLCRYAGLRIWHAIVCTLFGFYLASSAAAPFVREAVFAVLGFLS